jgi:hypothetical protein
MIVGFSKLERNGRQSVYWEAVRGTRTRVPGSFMAAGRDLPHDLAQYVIETATHYENGFWELVAKGATFNSTGRKVTKPGRAVIAGHRAALIGSEQLAAEHLHRWKSGECSPVTEALTAAFEQWQALDSNEQLVFRWPSAAGAIERPEQVAMRPWQR